MGYSGTGGIGYRYSDDIKACQKACAEGKGDQYRQHTDAFKRRWYPSIRDWRLANARMLHDQGYHLTSDVAFTKDYARLGL